MKGDANRINIAQYLGVTESQPVPKKQEKITILSHRKSRTHDTAFLYLDLDLILTCPFSLPNTN